LIGRRGAATWRGSELSRPIHRYSRFDKDSKGHKLPEPKALKLIALIEALEQFTEVKQKPNLKRLLR